MSSTRSGTEVSDAALRSPQSVRMLDRAIAAIGVVVLIPLLVVVAVGVRLSSRGPALHRADRAGIGGVPFTLYKFRSMRVGAAGPPVTAAGDPRVTPLGRLLRRSKVDELPQLLNVIRGDMGLVGPRPEDPSLVDLDDAMTSELYRYPPGITGPASLEFRDEERRLADIGGDPIEAYRQIAREKMAVDLRYLRNRSVSSDARLVVATLLGRTASP